MSSKISYSNARKSVLAIISCITAAISLTATPALAAVSLQDLQEGRLPPSTSTEFADICTATMGESLQNAQHDADEKQFEDLYFTFHMIWFDAALKLRRMSSPEAYSSISSYYVSLVRQLSETEFKGIQMECMNRAPVYKDTKK